MTAAQEGQVIPVASAVTLFTCANASVPTTIISSASNQICVRFLISKSLWSSMSLHYDRERNLLPVTQP
jgi:hypothetical protein